jgi:outer membrane protein assembly factor BamB
MNPSSASYGRTRIRYRPDAFPIDENDGTLLVDKVGAPGAPDSVAHTGLTDDATVFYAAFVDNGAGSFSLGRRTSGRPFNTSLTDAKWALSIGMTAIVPPGNGLGQIHAAGQDNSLHSMVKGASGGSWPPLWMPQSLAGPSQGRPSTIGLPVPIGGATRAIFLGTQAGTVYALNAETGAVLWSRTVSGPVQAAPSGWFSFFGGTAGMDYILVGTRDALPAALNRFYALRLADGSVAWSYDGSADSRKIGMISGQANVDYANKRVYFASAAFGAGAGERDTVWCLNLETGTRLWSAELADITGSPAARNGRLYVASYTPGSGGQIHALDASSGASVWGGATFLTPDSEGPVKSFVTPDRLSPTGRLLFSTINVLWALDDPDGSAPPSAPTWVRDANVDVTPIANPSTPALLAGGPYIWVGSSDGQLYRLDYDTGATQLATPLGDTALPAPVGSPTIDLRGGFLYVGSLAGVIYAVRLP